jgi:hypothetical protein
MGLDSQVNESTDCSARAWLVKAGLVEGVKDADGYVRYGRIRTADALFALRALAVNSHTPLSNSDGKAQPE